MKSLIAGVVGGVLAAIAVFSGVSVVQNASSVQEPSNPMSVQYADQ